MNKFHRFLILFSLVLLVSCQSFGKGPISEPIVGIGAALLAALDQLLVSGVLTPEQYMPLATGVKGISASMETAMQTITAVEKQIATAEASKWTPTEIGGCVTAGVGAAAAIATKITTVLRDRNYTPEELAQRQIARLKRRAKVA